MKNLGKALLVMALLAFLTGGLTSCSVFEKSRPSITKSYKHKQPVPKRYIVPEKTKKIIK